MTEQPEPSVTEERTIPDVDLPRLNQIARSMVRHIPAATTIGLVGTLGAGKTTLVQAIAHAAEIDAADVTSPTFTLLQTHRGRITIHHLDAYRVVDEDEFLELGVDELFEDDAWTLVEWADRVADVMPSDTLWIKIDLDASDARLLTFSCRDHSLDSIVKQIVAQIDPPKSL